MRIFHLWMSDSSRRLTFMPSGGERVMSASSWMGDSVSGFRRT